MARRWYYLRNLPLVVSKWETGGDSGEKQKRSNAAIRARFALFLVFKDPVLIAQDILCKAVHSLVA